MALLALTPVLGAQPSQWRSVGIGGGGAFFAPSWSPFQPDELFCTSDMTDFYRSTDQGWTWGAGALGLQVSPTDPNRVAYTDLGFLHLTTDGGTTWRQSYLEAADENPAGAPTPKYRSYHGIGLEDTACWGVTWIRPQRVLASMTDIRAMITDDGGSSWSQDYRGPLLNTMYRSVVHPTTGVVYAAESSVHDIYQSTHVTDAQDDRGTGSVLFSADDGANWQTLHDFGHPVVWVSLDPTSPTRLYASVVHSVQGGIFVSDDIQDGAASVWRRLPNPPRTQGHPYAIDVGGDGSLVVSFSGRRDTTVNRFTDSSGVFYSTDGGSTWSDRTGPLMHAWTKDVVVDPHDATRSTWYAGVFNAWGGFGNDLGGLYITRDKGLSWTRLTSGMAVESCTLDPTDPNGMYFTTETDGLWWSGDRQSAAPAFTQVPEYPFMHPMRVSWNPNDSSEIWVTSFGNGIRIGTTSLAPPAPRPVADGRWVQGTAMRALELRPDGANIHLTWDVTTCAPAAEYDLLFGPGSTVSSWTLSGSACALGTSGAYDWTGTPPLPAGERFVWWVLVGTDGAGTESSWGRTSTGAERHPGSASGMCANAVKDTSASCP